MALRHGDPAGPFSFADTEAGHPERPAADVDGSSRDLRLRLARRLLRAYPFLRGRWRLASLLLTGRPGGHQLVSAEAVLRGLVDGQPISCRWGLRFVAHRDRMYFEPFLFGTYEAGSSKLFRRIVRPGDTVIDAGANFGWYTVLLARSVGAAGRVIAFEPVPPLAGLAEDAVRRNSVQDVVRLERAGLGSYDGRFTVYTFKGLPHGHASASDLGRADAVAHDCRITTLDGYLERQRLTGVDFMKIDIEGHELELLAGATRLLGCETAPVIAFEVNLECLGHRGIAPGAIEALLRDHGYEYLWVIERGGGLRAVEHVHPGRNWDYLAAKPARLRVLTTTW